jgi:RpiB/LacA/LacB family sugar-phosphate isomerase
MIIAIGSDHAGLELKEQIKVFLSARGTLYKVRGIRAALCLTPAMADMSRRHNDANVLTLGGRLLTPKAAMDIVETWLSTAFEGDRHARRVGKIRSYEEKGRNR